MIGDAPRKTRGDEFQLHHICQEADEFMGFFSKGPGPRREAGIVREEFGIMMPDHARAGAGGRHDIIDAGECVHDIQRQRARGSPVAGIIGGLAAAGLGGHNDLAPGLFQKLHRSKAYRRAEQVDQTGDEKPDAGILRWACG